MKVLKQGRTEKKWSVESICTGAGNERDGCGAKLLVDEGDVYLTYNASIMRHQEYVTFRCPECGFETDLAGEGRRGSVPPRVWSAARANMSKRR